ncbi:lysophosphatidic acid receptor 6-like [Myripristis murdjan]|uniref:lysophosphatidic acid receptor 6-like n=1 Tax=Myripristis murdjan TaxID=586833 RepID=UPI001175E03C|nr:lysophosphatidic acid receptor 6-like [Myripristis murdjan]XP_029923286.1 lysophosphatidic acid receptor 6-like [Myripristis murdjan]XP_029923287.1 lysophosphatidic acid receptor 6-like [Myripristis murdjan]XP_029923288.1 lysophosphatidic acid receptor 6-like [Myripristis murdjan]XP_029923289.1 lysophosphatidic acid receptor 6-like [Myripristis murdjan]
MYNMNNTTMTANGSDTGNSNMAYAVVFGCVLVLGLPLNAVSLWTLIRHHSLKSSSAVFMINLALSDLLLVISLPMRVYFYATGSWPLGITACVSITMLFRNNVRSSSIFITFIAVDRLLAVVYPLRSRHLRTTTNAWKASVLVWLFVVGVNVPESVNFWRLLYNCNASRPTCFEFPQCRVFSSAVGHFQLILVFTMLAVNIVSTALVSWTLRRHLSDAARVNNRINVMLVYVINLLMFVIFFMPLTLTVLLKSGRHTIMAAVCLTTLNCCVDPLLYYFSLDAFWKKKEHVDSSLGNRIIGETSGHQLEN